MAGVDITMTDGGLLGAGFPGPLRTQWQPVGTKSGSGSGSTGGGFGGNASVSILIEDESGFAAGGTTLHVTGEANHFVEAGYTAVMSSTGFVLEPIVLTLTEPVTFAVVNASAARAVPGGATSAIVPVRLHAITGSIDGDPETGGTLAPGTYGLDVWIGAFAQGLFSVGIGEEFRQAGYASFIETGVASASADWSLQLQPVPQCGQSDLDCSGTVDVGDVALALLDYGPCPGCPADLDGSGEVDFGDVALIMLDFG